MSNLKRKSHFELISELLKDPDSKNAFTIFTDILRLTLHFKKFPRHYFGRYLFKKGKTNILDYCTDDFLYNKLKPALNEKAVSDVVENKLHFNFFYGQLGLPIPKVFMYNHKTRFVLGSKSMDIYTVSEFITTLQNLFALNPLADSIIVKRTYGSFGGDQVYKIHTRDISNTDLISDLFANVIKTGFIYQETVKQHAELNRLNPSCLNTIRMDTYIDNEGNAEVISAYIRMSTDNKPVDNISSGGCQVGVWLENGKLKNEGFLSFRSSGVLVLNTHPITKVTFEDFTIPFFNEAMDVVKKTALCMPGLRLVGWDVAISENGPVIIEGNSYYDASGNDLSEGGYLTNATFRKILRETNLS